MKLTASSRIIGSNAIKCRFQEKGTGMSKLSRAGVLTSAAFALVWLASSTPPVQAEETTGLAAGNVLVCDTSDEVEAVLTSKVGDMAARLNQANDRFGEEACSIVTAIFYRGDETKTVISEDGAVRIVKVDLIGFRSGDAWTRMSKPAAKYAGVLEDSTGI
jgi:hypothetical protein